jgi:hypothetical protein
VEAITYRFRGHSMADPEQYREKGEVRKWQKRDPIRVLDELLVKSGQVARRELHEIQRGVELQVADAIAFADNSPFPSIDTLFQNIYAQPLPDRGGAVSGPQVVIPELLARKAARLTHTAEERSRRQPALHTISDALAEDSGGPGGRPLAAAPEKASRTRKAAAGEGPPAAGPAEAAGTEEAVGAEISKPGANGSPAQRARVARKLPQPGRPGGR